MNKQRKLYQYQGVNNYSLQNLKNHQIYFNSPLNFNDPYDCLHTIKVKPLSNNLIAKTFGETYDSIELEKLTSKILDNSINQKELIEFNITLAQKEGKSMDFINKLGEEVQNEQNFESLKGAAKKLIVEQLNSIIHVSINKIQKNMAANHGISCFSETYNDLQMWAYYGDGHKGFCLEYDTSDEPFSKAKKVIYSEEAPVISYETFLNSEKENSDEDIIEKLLCTKFAQWQNEKEWRLIHKESNKLFTYTPKQLTGIYFGTKINKTQMEIIMTILVSQNPFVKFYRMEKDPSSFKIRPIEQNYLTHLQGQDLFFKQIIDLFKNHYFSISDAEGKMTPTIPKSNISIYIDNLTTLGFFEKKDNLYRLNV
ncbi:MAG: DUF2971 domain-containing protein [Spirosomataceae bacterium]